MSTHHHHCDAHHHSHAPTITQQNQRHIMISFWLIFSFMFIEAIGGMLSGSLALIADAGHMLTDAAALALAYLGFQFGKRRPDNHKTFGYLRYEVIAGLINALSMLLVIGWILYEAWLRLLMPKAVLAGPMLGVALIGLIVNVVVFGILSRGDSQHLNMKAAAIHVMGDLLSSVAAIVAAIIIHYTGWMPIDPLLSILAVILMLRSTWGLLRQSLHILLEGAAPHATPEKIQAHLLAHIPYLAAVNHIHSWQLNSEQSMATLHIRLTDDKQAQIAVEMVKQQLASHFDIAHSTVAIDWNDTPSPCYFSVSIKN